MANIVEAEVEPSRALVPSGAARREYSDSELALIGKEAFESGNYPTLKNRAQAIIRVQTGAAMGMDPWTSLRNVIVVGNTPSFSAGFISGRIKASYPRYDYQVIKKDHTGCTLEFFRHGKSQGKITWDEAKAKRAGLLPAKPGAAWVTYPHDMYFSRAVTEGCRTFCPDLLGVGVIAYTPEELGGVVAEAEPVHPVKVEVVKK